MKLLFTTSTLALVYTLLLANASAESVRGRQLQSSAAWYYGNAKALELWNTGIYPCAVNDILTDFWDDVKMDVYDDCEDQYGLNAGFVESCKNGAEAFVYEKTNECTTHADCVDLGNTQSVGVAYEFCAEARYGSMGSLFPELCLPIAISACQNNVLSQLSLLMAAGNCGTFTNVMQLSTSDYNGLMDDCEEEVTNYIENAHLPGDSTPPTGPGTTGEPTLSELIELCKDCKDDCRDEFPGYSNMSERIECKRDCREEFGREPCGMS